MDGNGDHHRQEIDYARGSLWAPFYTVGIAARIRGDVAPGPVEAALRALRTLYPPLASRVGVRADGSAWLTTEGVGELPLEVRPKRSAEDWAALFLEQERVPFPFERGPVARFYLLRGEESSDLVAVAPHLVCDGPAMTQVLLEAVALLNDPEREVSPPPPAPALTWRTVRHSPLDNLHLRALARLLNLAWPGSRVLLHQEQYEELHRRYWARQRNGLLSFRLAPDEVSDLAARCKRHGVSMTGALLAAFWLAQAEALPALPPPPATVSVAVNLRDRLIESPGAVVGVYASTLDFCLRTRPGISFWELAQQGHTRIHRGLGQRARLLLPLVLEELDPTIVDAFCVALCTDEWRRELGVLSHFIHVRGEKRALDISNFGRLDLPPAGARYPLLALLPFPPLVPGGRLMLNVLTVGGQMELILKYSELRLGGGAAGAIRDRALRFLTTA